jgi:dTDP-4-amino-4,6-dideoxygalactose transaminase
MKIPLVNLERLHQELRAEIDAAIAEVINSGQYINGAQVKEFEKNFALASGLRYMIGCANGTDAIAVLLKALGLGPGAEVIVPTLTFIATAEAVTAVGARARFADISADNYCLDFNALPKAITARTKAVLAVNLHGNPAHLAELRDICRERKIFLLEDSAQAHLAKVENQPVGSFGLAATFSFFPGKNLGALGDAGAIGTNDEALAMKLAKLVNHGRLRKYEHDIEGYNMRMDTLQAAVLDVKLKHLAAWTEKRRARADRYAKLLSGLPVILPYKKENVYNVYHLYVIRVKNRDKVLRYLQENGVEAGIHYPLPLHLQPAYKYLGYQKGDFPIAEKCAEEFLSLPLCPMLTDEEQDYVVQKLKEIL